MITYCEEEVCETSAVLGELCVAPYNIVDEMPNTVLQKSAWNSILLSFRFPPSKFPLLRIIKYYYGTNSNWPKTRLAKRADDVNAKRLIIMISQVSFSVFQCKAFFIALLIATPDANQNTFL